MLHQMLLLHMRSLRGLCCLHRLTPRFGIPSNAPVDEVAARGVCL